MPTENNDEPPPLPPSQKVSKIEKKQKERSKSRRLSEAKKTEENVSKTTPQKVNSSTGNVCDVCHQEGAPAESVR